MSPDAAASSSSLLRPAAVVGGAAALCLVPALAGASGTGDPQPVSLSSAIGLAVVAAAVLVVIMHRLRQPALLAYIVAGLVLSATAGRFIGDAVHAMEHVSHLGLVFLLFIIGLEMDLAGILRLGPRAALGVLAQAPALIGAIYGLQWLLRHFGVELPGVGSAPESWLYYAAAIAFGSTAVVIKLLGDKFELGTPAGRITVLTLIGEDVFAVSMLSYLSSSGSPSGAGADVVLTVLGGVLFVGAVFAFSKYVLARVLNALGSSPELLALVALGWCFLCAGGLSRFGLSAEMGALVAGITLKRLPHHTEVMAKVSNLRDFFMALFFVALGMSLPPPSLEVLLPAAVLVGLLYLARLLISAPILLASGLGPIVSFTAPINLAQVSEFSLLLIPMGVQLGALTRGDATIISYALMISVVISTYLIQHNHRLAMFFGRALGLTGHARAGRARAASAEGGDHGHHHGADIVWLGYFVNSEALAQELQARAPQLIPRTLVIDFDLKNHAKIARYGLRVAYGDISNPDTLRHHGIATAKVIVSTISNTFLRGITNEDLLDQVRAINPGARFITTAMDAAAAQAMVARGAFACVSPPVEAAPAYRTAIEQALAGAEATPQPELAG